MGRSFRVLLTTYQATSDGLTITCGRLHSLLRQLYQTRVRSRDLRVASLSTQVDFISTQTKLAVIRRGQLRAFHLASGTVLGQGRRPMHRGLLQSTGALTFFVHGLCRIRVPNRLCRLLPHTSTACLMTSPTGGQVRQVHMYCRCTSRRCLCMAPISAVTSRCLEVHCGIPRVGRRFTRAYRVL